MRIQFLDGVRALLALWVVFGHLAGPVGFKLPVVDNPAIAVDLFMLLSGYFIAATYGRLAQEHDPWTAARYFWIRRVMRIWPVYVVTLTIVWLFLNPLSELLIAQVNAFTAPGSASVARAYPEVTPLRALLHYTMLFGVVPSQATSTPLPDWSLSLEFQFYLLFPLLAIGLRRRPLMLCFAAAAMGFVSPKLLGNYLEPGILAHFRQPAFLPYRLDFFLLGCMAFMVFKPGKSLAEVEWKVPLLAFLLCLANAGAQATVGAFGILYLLAVPDSKAAQWLSRPTIRWLGRISFSIYLAHAPLMRMVVGYLVGESWFTGLPAPARYGVALACELPLILLAAHVLHVFVEQPAIRVAHRWTGEGRSSRVTAPVLAAGEKAS